MINIDSMLSNLKVDISFKKYSVLLSSIMFLWSGVDKINNFQKKVDTLSNKLNLDNKVCSFGMILVILLETIGFLLLGEYFMNKKIFYNLIDKFNIFIKLTQKQVIQIILLSILLFLVVVTLIYHPPWGKPIPFLSNLTIFSLYLYIYSDLYSKNIDN